MADERRRADAEQHGTARADRPQPEANRLVGHLVGVQRSAGNRAATAVAQTLRADRDDSGPEAEATPEDGSAAGAHDGAPAPAGAPPPAPPPDAGGAAPPGGGGGSGGGGDGAPPGGGPERPAVAPVENPPTVESTLDQQARAPERPEPELPGTPPRPASPVPEALEASSAQARHQVGQERATVTPPAPPQERLAELTGEDAGPAGGEPGAAGGEPDGAGGGAVAEAGPPAGAPAAGPGGPAQPAPPNPLEAPDPELQAVVVAHSEGTAGLQAAIAEALATIDARLVEQQRAVDEAATQQVAQGSAAVRRARQRVSGAVTQAKSRLTQAGQAATGRLTQARTTQTGAASALAEGEAQRARTLGATKGDEIVRTAQERARTARTAVSDKAAQARATGRRAGGAAHDQNSEAVTAMRRAADEVANQTAGEISTSLGTTADDLARSGGEVRPDIVSAANSLADGLTRQLGPLRQQLETNLTGAATELANTLSATNTSLDNVGRSTLAGLDALDRSLRQSVQARATAGKAALAQSAAQGRAGVRQRGDATLTAGRTSAQSILSELTSRGTRRRMARSLADQAAAQLRQGLGVSADQARAAGNAIGAAFAQSAAAVHQTLVEAGAQAGEHAEQQGRQGTQGLASMAASLVTQLEALATQSIERGDSALASARTSFTGSVASAETNLTGAVTRFGERLDTHVNEARSRADAPLHDLESRITTAMERARRRANDGWLIDQLRQVGEALRNPSFWAGLIVGLLVTIAVIAICGTGIGALILAGALAGAASVAASTLTDNAINNRPTDWGRLGRDMLIGAAFGALGGALGAGATGAIMGRAGGTALAAIGRSLGASMTQAAVNRAAQVVIGTGLGVVQNVCEGHPWDQGLLLNAGLAVGMSSRRFESAMQHVTEGARAQAVDRGMALNVTEPEIAAAGRRMEERLLGPEETAPAGGTGGGGTEPAAGGEPAGAGEAGGAPDQTSTTRPGDETTPGTSRPGDETTPGTGRPGDETTPGTGRPGDETAGATAGTTPTEGQGRSAPGDRQVIPVEDVRERMRRAADPEARGRDQRSLADILRQDFGMPGRNVERIQRICEMFGVEIDVRPTNPEAPRLLEAGHIPKPEDIKAKSITPDDVHLGARPEDVGLIGYFEPEVPTRPPGMDDATWARIEQRYVQRYNEYHQLGEHMANLGLPVGEQEHTSGRFRMGVDENGVVRLADAEGRLTERGITGDHDVYDIRLPSGEPVPMDLYDRIVNAMIEGDMGVQHGAHLFWDAPPEYRGIRNDIVARHQPGGEPLVRFGPGRDPDFGWSREQLPPPDSPEGRPHPAPAGAGPDTTPTGATTPADTTPTGATTPADTTPTRPAPPPDERATVPPAGPEEPGPSERPTVAPPRPGPDDVGPGGPSTLGPDDLTPPMGTPRPSFLDDLGGRGPGGPSDGDRGRGPGPGPGPRRVTGPVGHDAPVPGPTTLSPAELAELQAIADRFQTELYVIGSRGEGRGRNVQTDLPVGKGDNTRSDIDVMIDGDADIRSSGRLSHTVSGACNGVANVASSTGMPHGKYIVIAPRPR